jgi:hypothetical protein
MFEFIHFKKYELILLDTMVSYQHGTLCIWAKIMMSFSLNFLGASDDLNAWHWFYIRVEYQRMRGGNGAKERILGGNGWLTGDVASAHAVIVKKTENYIHY